MFVVSRKLLDDSGLDDDDEFRKSLNLVKEWAAARCSTGDAAPSASAATFEDCQTVI